MYTPVHIGPMSPMQKKKLVIGHPVTVNPGRTHVIHVSPENVKKITRAHMKGKGVRIMMDPYCASQHGEGLMGDLFSKAKSAVKSTVRQNLPKMTQLASQQLQKAGLSERAASSLANLGSSHVSKLIGQGLPTHVVPAHKPRGRPRKHPLAAAARPRGRPRKHPSGGKLNVGKMIVSGLKKIARPALKGISKAAISGFSDLVESPELSPILQHEADRGINALGRRYGFGFGGALVPP